jgi:hypothetical protein
MMREVAQKKKNTNIKPVSVYAKGYMPAFAQEQRDSDWRSKFGSDRSGVSENVALK